MPVYTVEWTIAGIEAGSPAEAVRFVRDIQANPRNIATCYRVTDEETGETRLKDWSRELGLENPEPPPQSLK